MDKRITLQHIYIYIYTYIERERKREMTRRMKREMRRYKTNKNKTLKGRKGGGEGTRTHTCYPDIRVCNVNSEKKRGAAL